MSVSDFLFRIFQIVILIVVCFGAPLYLLKLIGEESKQKGYSLSQLIATLSLIVWMSKSVEWLLEWDDPISIYQVCKDYKYWSKEDTMNFDFYAIDDEERLRFDKFCTEYIGEEPQIEYVRDD